MNFTVRIENVSTPATLKLSNGQTAPAPNAPTLWVVHTEQEPIFTPCAKDRGQGLESLAEDGDPSRLADALKGTKGVVNVGFVNKPVGSILPGPALPGKAHEFSFTATPGQKLSIAPMFGQSNSAFFANGPRGIELFDGRGVAQDDGRRCNASPPVVRRRAKGIGRRTSGHGLQSTGIVTDTEPPMVRPVYTT